MDFIDVLVSLYLVFFCQVMANSQKQNKNLSKIKSNLVDCSVLICLGLYRHYRTSA